MEKTYKYLVSQVHFPFSHSFFFAYLAQPQGVAVLFVPLSSTREQTTELTSSSRTHENKQAKGRKNKEI